MVATATGVLYLDVLIESFSGLDFSSIHPPPVYIIVYVSYLEDKGDRFAFVDGKVLVWSKGSSIDDARVIRIHDGRFCRLVSQPDRALVHDEIDPSGLCH